MNTYIASFPNCGYLGHTFTDAELAPIQHEINFIKNNFKIAEPIDHSFTSTVKKEYKLISSKNHLETLVIPFTKIYLESFDFPLEKKEFELDAAWVNFQEKGEFFTPHTHRGNFSFVIYIEIPFFIEDEIKCVSSDSKQISTVSSFSFFYTDSLGEIKPNILLIDKTWENKMLFFPGKMLHSVQPFQSSDKFRISVSGNIKIK